MVKTERIAPKDTGSDSGSVLVSRNRVEPEGLVSSWFLSQQHRLDHVDTMNTCGTLVSCNRVCVLITLASRITWVTGSPLNMGLRRNLTFHWQDQTHTAWFSSRLLASRGITVKRAWLASCAETRCQVSSCSYNPLRGNGLCVIMTRPCIRSLITFVSCNFPFTYIQGTESAFMNAVSN